MVEINDIPYMLWEFIKPGLKWYLDGFAYYFYLMVDFLRDTLYNPAYRLFLENPQLFVLLGFAIVMASSGIIFSAYQLGKRRKISIQKEEDRLMRLIKTVELFEIFPSSDAADDLFAQEVKPEDDILEVAGVLRQWHDGEYVKYLIRKRVYGFVGE